MRERNGDIGQIPRVVGHVGLGNKNIHLLASGDYGTDQNRNTGSNYARLTGLIAVARPMIVSAILWDIRTADTYICRFTSTGNGTTSVFDVNTAHVSAGGGEDVITPTNGDFLLMPGMHFLQLATDDAATVGWSDRNATYEDFTYWQNIYCWYTTTFSSYTIPIKFRACVIEYSNMVEYIR